MSLTLKVPSIGESIREATVGVWKKVEGDWVNLDEPLVEIESEKATLEIPSPGAGLLKKILRRQGETVAIGEALADIDENAKPVLPPALGVPPSARRLMAESGLAVEEVKGTGRGGRIQPLDVSRTLDSRKGADGGGTSTFVNAPTPTPVPGAVRAMVPGLAPAPAPASVPAALPEAFMDAGRERVVPMTPLRKTIARRLVEAQHTAAILTTFNEIDMSGVLAMRERYQDRFTKQHGIKLGFMGFFVKAVIEALKAFPSVNAEIRGTDIVYKDHYDIGVAVGGGKGLVVPVIRGADRLSFADLEKTVAALAGKAKDNKLQLTDLEGGTFTISNGGVYGSMMSTPILNPPQSGILGLHAISKRAVVVDDQIVVRPMMYVALSYDHRIVDGREAVQFLVRVKDCVETPERILLEI
jgi:2-oxoglutarate dehydrogenase E2 component (dihydrolipoamide succinyltransferase)